MPVPKTSIIPDLAMFVKNLPADMPYDDLLKTANDAGWLYKLTEKAVSIAPDSSVLVTYIVSVGNDIAALERLDEVTLRLPPGPGPVSLVARAQLAPTLIYLFFGRLPPGMLVGHPATPPMPAPQPGQMNGGDAYPGNAYEGSQHLVDDGGYVDDEPAAPAVNVVAKREPDGLPIFVDLYALGDRSEDVINAILDEVQDFLKMAGSVEQIDAVALKNPDMVAFIKDLGTAEDRAELSQSINARRRELTVPAAAAAANAPRRRARVPQAN